MHADRYLKEVAEIAGRLDRDDIERLARALHTVREINGRVFVVGLGGSYSNAEHCAADLRKLCEIEAQAPNVAEWSAYWNDEGPECAFVGHLRFMTDKDAVLVLSVGGGTPEVSKALHHTALACRTQGIPLLAIVGPHGGAAAASAQVAVKIPAAGDRVTPHTEAFQAVVWHLLVSHPMLQRRATKW